MRRIEFYGTPVSTYETRNIKLVVWGIKLYFVVTHNYCTHVSTYAIF